MVFTEGFTDSLMLLLVSLQRRGRFYCPIVCVFSIWGFNLRFPLKFENHCLGRKKDGSGGRKKEGREEGKEERREEGREGRKKERRKDGQNLLFVLYINKSPNTWWKIKGQCSLPRKGRKKCVPVAGRKVRIFSEGLNSISWDKTCIVE